MKRSFSLILCLVLVLSLLASCMSTEDQEHKHTYGATWSSNEAGHWYAATCEHTDLKANMSTHQDPANDGVCDVCGYGSDHVHTYDTVNWTSDENNHWNAVTCGHNVDPKNKAAHADTNNDGDCDTCGYNGGHAHTAKTEWTFDGTDHWHAVTCGHDVVVDKAAHVDAEKDGICDVCGHDVTKHDTPAHTHTWATAWTTDADAHWYVGTCEHTGAINSYGLHIGTADDGVCDTCGWYDAGHTHTYNTSVWAKDDTNHWNPASCGHTALKSNEAAHADTDNDGECDTCGYTSHEHTFSDTWSKDETNHWHAANCGNGCSAVTMVTPHHGMGDGICDACGYTNYDSNHDHEELAEWVIEEDAHYKVCPDHEDMVYYYESHYDDNDDGYCDVCAHTDMADDHTHTWPTPAEGEELPWVAGPDSHWHAADCHSFYKADEAAHTDEDTDGKCDVCEGVIFDSIIEEATSEAAANAVNNGMIDIWDTYEDYYEGTVTDISTLSFEFGNKFFHVRTLDGTEEWYSTYSVLNQETGVNEDKIFAVYDYDVTDFGNALQSVYGATLDNINGYAFNLNYTYEGYGVSDIIAELYAAAGEQAYVEKAIMEDVSGTTYSFSFITSGYYCYLYEVSFTMATTEDGQTYVDWAEISTAMYSASELTEVTDEDTQATYYVLNADSEAQSSKSWVVTQNAGERTATNDKKANTYLARSFRLQDAEGNRVNNGDTITMTLGEEPTKLFFASVSPGTAEWGLDDVSYVTTDKDGNEVYDVNVYLQSDWETGEYYLQFTENWSATAGVYTVEISTSRASYTVIVNLVAPPLESMTVQTLQEVTSPWGDTYNEMVDSTEATVMEGSPLKFQIAANPEAANASFTYKVTVDGTEVTEGITYDAGNPAAYAYASFTFAKAGTYVITFTSVENTEITCTLTVTVEKAPTAADLLQGKLFYKDAWGGGTVIIEFTPASEGADNGTAVINYNGETTVNYAYDETNGVVFTNTDGSAYTAVSVSIAADYSLTVAFGPYSGTLAEYSLTAVLAGTFTDAASYYDTPNYEIVLNNDGTGTFATMETYFYSYEMFTWEAEAQADGSYNLTLTASGGMLNYDYAEFDATTANATYTAEGKLVLTLTVGGTATEVTLNAR